MKLKQNITLGKIFLCTYLKTQIYSYVNDSMTLKLMTLSVDNEPFSQLYLFIRTLSCVPVGLSSFIALPILSEMRIVQWICSLPSRWTNIPVLPALRTHAQSQCEFEASWPTQGQPISKIQKEINNKEFKSWDCQNI